MTHRVRCGCSSGVEHNLAKVGVGGSNPLARSRFKKGHGPTAFEFGPGNHQSARPSCAAAVRLGAGIHPEESCRLPDKISGQTGVPCLTPICWRETSTDFDPARGQVLRMQRRFAEAIPEYEAALAFIATGWLQSYRLGPVQALYWIDRGLHPPRGASPPAQPSRSESEFGIHKSGRCICCSRALTRQLSGSKGRVTPLPYTL